MSECCEGNSCAPMRKVFSLAWFRSDQSGYESDRCGASKGIFFMGHLPAVIRAQQYVFPDWRLVIHHDDRVMDLPYFKPILKMHEKGLLKLVYMGKAETLTGSMLWRLAPLFDPEVQVVACRDIDSLPMERDRKMLETFVADPRATIHVLHDSESHSGPLMGGMLAVKGEPFRQAVGGVEAMRSELSAWTDRLRVLGGDQHFMNNVLYPKMAQGLMIHTRRQMTNYGCYKALPALPQESELDKVIKHVGASFDCNKVLAILKDRAYPGKACIEECEA